MFTPVGGQIDFSASERDRLNKWYQEGVVDKYLHRNDASSKRFSFLDGPITANNPMGVHHAWGRSLKDLYQRFWNMRGYKQRFQNGFDNQGLWVEVEVEKKLGFKNKKDIEEYGIDKFVNDCKEHTQHFANVQIEQSKRLGYFMDWGHDYYTMSEENNYAIWHFLKTCFEKGWLYKGRDSVPWCPRCGTAISQHEILTEEYQELTHDSVYLKLPIKDRAGEYFLVWTTTPWTIPGNVALAVHPGLDYQLVEDGIGNRYWLVASLVKSVFGDKVKTVEHKKGSELTGWGYTGPFDDLSAVVLAREENPDTFHTVVASEELVNEEGGTGIVHIAPGCGGEDFALAKEKNLSVLAVIDETASYLEGFGDLSKTNAKADPNLVIQHPLVKDFIYEVRPFTHRYPTCWRCKSELVWRVVDEWYIGMDRGDDSLRQRLLKLPGQIRWIPSFGKERELDWLNNMDDWMISKKRYWGLALPIWECGCGHFQVIGSKEELREKAVAGWEEFDGHTPHRPWIDQVKVKCPQCGEVSSRVLDVGNPWLDAGIVAYSTLKYFSDKEYWKQWFPANLVLECFPGQFKNWFYSLLAMSGALENRPPFETLLGHEMVVDEYGEEMHKSKGNAIWFDEAAEKMGVDVMRWIYATQNPTLRLRFGYEIADEVRRRFILILWNSYKFFVSKANEVDWSPKKKSVVSAHILDRWLTSRLNSLVVTVTESLERYENAIASQAIEEFVVKDLSTWYVRRSRDRLGAQAQPEEREGGLSTFYSTLVTLSQLTAPILPFISEEIYLNLVPEDDSVHLSDWPVADKSLIDSELEEKMTALRLLVEEIHATRKEAEIKVRQPLQAYYSFSKDFSRLLQQEEELLAICRDEVNVKGIVFASEDTGDLEQVIFTPNRNGALDLEITEELKAEGSARELMREIQKQRKEQGLQVGDLVDVTYPAGEDTERAVALFGEEIKQKTSAKSLTIGNDLRVSPAP